MSKLKVGGKTYTMGDDAIPEYRSHIGRCCAINPDNWVSLICTDENGNEVKAWYYVENLDEVELDCIDYNKPHDIEDEDRNIIWSVD